MKKITFSILIMSIALLGGCSKKREDMAKEAVTKLLIDPSSAQFRNLREPSPGIICGEVNGKNKFGGYAGFQEFYWSLAEPDSPKILEEPSILCK